MTSKHGIGIGVRILLAALWGLVTIIVTFQSVVQLADWLAGHL